MSARPTMADTAAAERARPAPQHDLGREIARLDREEKHWFDEADRIQKSFKFAEAKGYSAQHQAEHLRRELHEATIRQAATAPLIEALERIAGATPNNTNSASAEAMASWCHAVAETALADIEGRS